jgi:hypothetical protein
MTANRFALPTAWPETVRAALESVQHYRSDVDAPHTGRTAKAERRHSARVLAIEAALIESIATHGLHGGTP